MKELEDTHKDKIEIVTQSEKKKTLQFQDERLVPAGLKCWQLEIATGYVTLADMEGELKHEPVTQVAHMKIKNKNEVTVQRRVIQKEGFVYVFALNKRNAVRKFLEKARNLPEKKI